ncbi:hypothetical protein L195_g001093 [Trifolium pratense]|uniref:DUF2470 domain-containing protein n=1 Tax=Trifolium pratense TaxID=57577 RepID=A0A2K3NNP9_TRIPR|nr:hypothetical protein L195_g001093 [Trifolium pratense]
MKRSKTTVLTFAEKCKNILTSNWQGSLNTIKVDAKDSKGNIHTSKVKYILRRGQPYLWVPENDLHNMNTMIDERGSFAVTSPFPGRLGAILKSLEKLPARVALSGDVLPLKEDKSKLLTEKLQEVILSEQKATKEFSYTVSGVLSSSGSRTSRSGNLQELLEDTEKYSIYRFKTRSCTFIDAHGSTSEVDVEDLAKCKADLLAPLSAKLIDGINQSEARRRALVLLCVVHMDANAKDAYMTSVDRKGFNVLAKVAGPVSNDGVGQYLWEEFRFMFEKEANDVEMFCNNLVEMEQEVINKVSAFSGLN